MAHRKTVIIGGVAGGASCAARLRRLDGDREIIILERGKYISYANCGLPYHVGDVIKNRNSLLLMTPELMYERFRIDARVNNEAISIDRNKKLVAVRDLVSGREYLESYDDLVIATGSSPLRPKIPGIDSKRIHTLWTVPDTDTIRGLVQSRWISNVAVIGGGFIGLEMAENLVHAGMKVTLIEAMDQVMAPLDIEMARILHENIRQSGVMLYLSDGVDSFEETGRHITVHLKSGRELQVELVILAIGVRPNSQLAKEAKLPLNDRGGIIVDSHMRTEDPSIYGVGDVAEVTDFVSGGRTMVPLAGPANKQGRIAADNLAGRDSVYEGTQGSSVAKVFDLTAAATGANEKSLIRQGFERGRDYEILIITQNSHAGYYPGATPLTIKLLFGSKDGRIIGAQIIGRDGVDKRIDTIGVALRLGADVNALKDLELAYAPPYSSAKDPVNMAGYVAENIMTGLVSFAGWDEPERNPDATLLDVREKAETVVSPVPGAIHIPLGKLRDQLNQLDREKEYIVFCAIGVRAYYAARFLAQNGFGHVKVYPGGVRFFNVNHVQEDTPIKLAPKSGGEGKAQKRNNDASIKRAHLDCSGMQCPGPIMEVFRSMENMKAGELLEVTASDPGFAKDIASWCRKTGNTLVSSTEDNGSYVAVIQRGGGNSDFVEPTRHTPKGKTIVVFDGDMDKILASFVIANGALAMGRPVTMFFTFWGLTALRRPEKMKTRKNVIESMFGAMLPRGASRTKLSHMNMGGIGTAMMKKIMKDKNIESVQAMMEKAMQNGLKIIACSMSMDVMGIRPEELIDGVEIGGVGSYLGDAEDADVNLFI